MRRRKARTDVAVEVGTESVQRIPAWFGEAVLLGKYWQESGLVGYLEEEVRVVRGRMGRYEVMDFVLLLISYAISGERTIADFYRLLSPVKEVLMSQWGRDRCPSASSLSRFLGSVGASAVESLRRLFESDLQRNSVRVKQEVGMFDRVGEHSVVFDIDGTVCAVRQRAIASDAKNDPPAVRRSEGACAPGYRGRKRGEVIRNRTTVCVAQTGEWLGSYGSAGNGEAKRELERCCGVIVRYLQQQGLAVGQGLVRLDGLYGMAGLVSVVQATGLGYILRCRDYQLLETESVKGRLERAVASDWQRLEDSASELLDVGYIEDLGRGYPAPMRVIVMRTPRQEHRAKIGKRVKEQVYELFLTSQSAASLSSQDVISLYRGRGGFEQRLSEEDQEQDYDRWCSWNEFGQEFWQILGQWSWNWRLWMGYQEEPVEMRQTVWVEVESEKESLEGSEPSKSVDVELPASLASLEGVSALSAVKTGSEEASGILYGAMRISTEWGIGLGGKNQFGNSDFQIVNDQTVLCPAGHQMYRRMRQQQPNGDIKMQYGINPKHCQKCPVRRRCLAPKSKGIGGRRVTVIRPVISEVTSGLPRIELSKDSALVRSVVQWVGSAKQAEQPILWCDIAATRLRRGWHQRLALFEVQISEIPGLSPTPSKAAKLMNRREREHHRLSWWERNERNMRGGEQEQWRVVLPEIATRLLEGMERLSKRSFVATG
jgi:hypothetical protein